MSFEWWTLLVVAAVPACGGDRLALGGGGDSGCVPGVYVGTYNCGGGADASSFPPGTAAGTLALPLQGDLGGGSLAIAPGTKVSSVQSGDTFESAVSGTLDCATNRLTATLGDLVVTSAAGKLATIYQRQPMTADYVPDGSPPALLNGVMELSQAQPGLTLTCTWSAQLHP